MEFTCNESRSDFGVRRIHMYSPRRPVAIRRESTDQKVKGWKHLMWLNGFQCNENCSPTSPAPTSAPTSPAPTSIRATTLARSILYVKEYSHSLQQQEYWLDFNNEGYAMVFLTSFTIACELHDWTSMEFTWLDFNNHIVLKEYDWTSMEFTCYITKAI
jgi:hypothetical protein